MLIFPREVESTQHHSSLVLSTPCAGTVAKYLVVLRRRSFSSIYFIVCQYCQHACYIHDIHHSYIFASFMHSCIFQCLLYIPFFRIYLTQKKKKKKKAKKKGKKKEKE